MLRRQKFTESKQRINMKSLIYSPARISSLYSKALKHVRGPISSSKRRGYNTGLQEMSNIVLKNLLNLSLDWVLIAIVCLLCILSVTCCN